MSSYVKSTNFASKDSLAVGNPLKIVKGTEIDAEFNNIATAVATKADLADPTFTGVPVAPTASPGTSTTQLATTAFVGTAITAYDTALTVSTAQIETNAVTPTKLSTGAPSWDTGGNFSVPNGVSIGASAGNGGAYIEVGSGRTGNGGAYIDLHGSPGLDFSSRIFRDAGVNGILNIQQTGTGAVSIYRDATLMASFSDVGQFSFNSGYGGVAVAYGCRAWVNFNGTGTVAIRGSGNVSSITDNGVGDYTVNFTTAMADANYSASCQVEYPGIGTYLAGGNSSARVAGSYRFWSWGGSSTADFPSINCNFFR